MPERLLVNVTTALDLGPGTLDVGVKNLFNEDDPSIVAEANNGFGFLPDEGRRVFIGYTAEF